VNTSNRFYCIECKQTFQKSVGIFTVTYNISFIYPAIVDVIVLTYGKVNFTLHVQEVYHLADSQPSVQEMRMGHIVLGQHQVDFFIELM